MKQGPPDERPDDTSSMSFGRRPQSATQAEDRSLLLVDDDEPLVNRLMRAMEARGFVVSTGEIGSRGVGRGDLAREAPAFAVIDMRLADGNGLDVMSDLKAKRPRRTRHHPHGIREYRDGRHRGEARRLRLSPPSRPMPTRSTAP